jgi:hypothetical protein
MTQAGPINVDITSTNIDIRPLQSSVDTITVVQDSDVNVVQVGAVKAEVGVGSGLTGIENMRITDEGALISVPRCTTLTLSDNISNTKELPKSCGGNFVATPTVPYVYNGSTWDRIRGSTEGLDVSVQGTANVQVQNTVDVCLTNAMVPVGIIGTDGPLDVCVSNTAPIEVINEEMGAIRYYGIGNTGTSPLNPGLVYGLAFAINTSVVNAVHLYDLSGAATSSDVPKMSFGFGSSRPFFYSFPGPVRFTNGLSVRGTPGLNPTSTGAIATENTLMLFKK